MDLVHSACAFRTRGRDAAADGPGRVRTHALVRGAGESPQQPRHGDLLRGRQGHRLVFRAEPFLRAVCRPLSVGLDAPHPARRTRGAADCRGAHLDRGRPFPRTFGYRHPLAGPRGREDPAAAEHLAGRRLDHHPAAGQEPLSARHGPQPRGHRPQSQTRDGEIQGVDNGPQTRIQLHQGGDCRDVPQYGGIRLECLRHQVGGPYLLQQGARRTERAGGGRAGGRGERPDALFPRAQSGQRPRAPQPRAFAHGGCRGADAPAAGLDFGAAHRAEL